MNNIEVIGIIADIFLFASFTFNNVRKIRILNMIGSALFVIYGIYLNAFSIYVFNGACIILQIYKLMRDNKQSDIEISNE